MLHSIFIGWPIPWGDDPNTNGKIINKTVFMLTWNVFLTTENTVVVLNMATNDYQSN